MCGIFGILCRQDNSLGKKDRKNAVDALFKLSESRGKEASGLYIDDGKRIQVYKSALRATEFIKQIQYTSLIDSDWRMFVGHSRLATNGDISQNQNNQPIARGMFVGVHNGIITNEKELWSTMKSTPKLGIDTEVLLALYESYYQKYGIERGIQKVFSEIEGEASIALRCLENDLLMLATNTGSVYYAWVKQRSMFVFASERYIVQTWLQDLKLSASVSQLKPGRALRIHLFTHQSLQFSLTDKQRFLPIKEYPNRVVVDHSEYISNTKKRSSKNSLSALRKHDFDYKKIYAIKRCTRCILPVTTPFITFDLHGVCSYCRDHLPITYSGHRAFEQLIAPYRSRNGEPDCLVGFSGGRDSSYGLHLLKKKFGLNPIAYTFDWGMLSDLGRKNAARVVGSLGVEHIVVSADIAKKRENIRKNILAWMKKPTLGMVPLFMAGDKEAEYRMNELIKKTGLQLVIYCRGNSFERDEFKTGHAGVSDADPDGVIHHLSWMGKFKLALYYGREFLANPAYMNTSLLDTAKAYATTYLIPHNYVYLWHYLPWSEADIVSTLRREYNWQTLADNPATWRIDDASPAFYNYIYYQVQGFTEHDSLRSHQIREGILSRKEAWELVCEENRPRYDALQWYFDVLQLNGDEVLNVVDSMKFYY